MIRSKKELKSILSAEYDLYDKDYGFGSLLNRVKLFFVHDRRYTIWRFQKYMRYADYYKHTYEGMRILNIVLFYGILEKEVVWENVWVLTSLVIIFLLVFNCTMQML